VKYFICGFTGSGKTYTLKLLKEKLSDYELVDLDDYIFKKLENYESLGEYINKVGFDAFRQDEVNALKELSYRDKIIISLGGGSLSFETIKLLSGFKGLWLNTDFDECLKRILGDEKRPIASLPKKELLKIYNQRLGFYHKYEACQSPEQIVSHILDAVTCQRK